MKRARTVRIAWDTVAKRDGAHLSWSKILIPNDGVSANHSTLGYSCFPPGAVGETVIHDTEEIVFVVQGRGELRSDDGCVEFGEMDAIFIPPHVWHSVVNTGKIDVIMVFSFPHPQYPTTDVREDS